jgi:hypothetical protein
MRRLGLGALVASSALLFTFPAAADSDDAPASVTTSYSPYELAAIHDAEKKLGAEIDPNAEGKIIESIETVRLDPIEKRDPAPTALNVVHVTTKEDVVRHEVLLRVGEPYRKVLADESARNIRSFMYVSIVAVIAIKGHAADRVRLVVITKDVWSLIVDVDFVVTAGGPEFLMFEVEENNVAGRQVGFSTRSIVQPESVSFGAAYDAARFAGRFLKFSAEGNVIINRRSGNPEGSFGHARLERPLFSTRTPWAWTTAMTWQDEIFRRYTNAKVAQFKNQLPWLWRSRRIDETLSVTRSYGWARKNDFTFGGILVRDLYRVPNADDFDAQLVADFARETLPVGETRVSAFAQWRSYSNDFLRIRDFETLGLQEDYRLGYDVVLRGYPVVKALGSTRDFFGMRAAGVYTIAAGDGFVRAVIDTTTEAQTERIADASIAGEFRIVSPRTPAGRLIFDVAGTNRWRNYLNRVSVLGGEDRLRGWPTRYFVGKNVFAMNLELRSRPVEVFSLQMGAALFYDVGRAFNGDFSEISPVQSVGAGIRLVLPQIDRAVVRGDFGFPIAAGDLPADVDRMSFFFSFGQAFRATHLPGPFGP